MPFSHEIKGTKKKMRNAVAIIGLPGVGFVGYNAVSSLINKYKAKLIASLYSTGFRPRVFSEDGNLTFDCYAVYHKNLKGKDYLFVLGTTQPEDYFSQYQVAEMLLDFLDKRGTKELYVLASYSDPELKSQSVRAVFSDVSTASDFKGKKLAFLPSGKITGGAGLLLGICGLKGMRGIGLLGDTYGHIVSEAGDILPDWSAAMLVENKLSELLSLPKLHR